MSLPTLDTYYLSRHRLRRKRFMAPVCRTQFLHSHTVPDRFFVLCQFIAARLIAFGSLVTVSNVLLSCSYHAYMSELYRTRRRARAVGFVYSFSRLSTVFSSFMIAFFLQRFGSIGVAGARWGRLRIKLSEQRFSSFTFRSLILRRSPGREPRLVLGLVLDVEMSRIS